MRSWEWGSDDSTRILKKRKIDLCNWEAEVEGSQARERDKKMMMMMHKLAYKLKKQDLKKKKKALP